MYEQGLQENGISEVQVFSSCVGYAVTIIRCTKPANILGE